MQYKGSDSSEAVTQVDEVRAERSNGAIDIAAMLQIVCNIPLFKRYPKGFEFVPILPKEPDRFPEDLLDSEVATKSDWWLLYTKSRQEKQLMRQLRELNLSHYGPQIEQRKRSPAGRVRTSFVPLFSNYVFMCGTEEDRYNAVCTGCVQKVTEITDVEILLADLHQISDLISIGAPMSIEERILPGQHVRVKNGPFAGFEGVVIRRDQETRLLVSVQFMDQGVSVKLDDCQLEPLGTPSDGSAIAKE
ncbi:KOW motif-containing protein [Stieleria sp. JC731]|uniref:transcription termination/antitermination protein NusG n=1 Tax=Pirellulaceae TaxID=2691357 RepID=UPI001E356B50|nr:transcription termination/antitermination NusG family protein [Stieleria sp. JC731]MCC9601103.1 KOW motif-containing protein [Stieleria sp. JC731]